MGSSLNEKFHVDVDFEIAGGERITFLAFKLAVDELNDCRTR